MNIKLECPTCNNHFELIPSQYKKRINDLKLKTSKLTCSNKCRISYLNKTLRRDINSPFKRLFHHAKHNRKHKGCTITVDDIRMQWELQKGICPYTGLEMLIPETSKICVEYSPRMASLDRIDSSKPYELGNIQIVCISMNFAKNSFTDEQIKEFINEIRQV